MCTTLAVSLSGCQAWKRGGTPNRKRLTDIQMLALIRVIHAESKGDCGSPRMAEEIRGRGFPARNELVERLMRENGVHVRHKRPFKETTDSKHSLPAAPNQVWAVPRRLVDQIQDGSGHRDRCADDGLVPQEAGPGLIHYSDRENQYASHAFQARLKEYGTTRSMSRKVNCWDNASTESVFNSFKNERVHRTRYETREAAIADTFDYIEPFYNRRRRHFTRGYASPLDYLADWVRSQHEQKLAA